MLQVCTIESPKTLKSSAIILNTFKDLDKHVLDAMRERIGRPIYTIGPVASFSQFESNDRLKSVSMSLWNEEDTCVEWLNDKKPKSVVYVNFGSVTVATPNQLNEFAWGLVNSQRPFIWVIREDLVFGKSATLEKTFVEETKERGLILSWCNQIKVLSHPAVGYVCKEWGIGMEINNDVKREEVKTLVRELMEGEKGKEMQLKAKKWKEISKTVVQLGGSSYNNLEAYKASASRETLIKSTCSHIYLFNV
ncbi:hypothetical protein AMTR_s00038p00226720 [Amborella trichopoda]|uniref:UDP-glycosyltransferases domain-containing protein n=1 Tax=Amborella trichopoda TaxID=13333 RepID=U5D2Y3_AMBTC|nr:hypothetical protein AMTR_s00038p00226720 [Amborella trichopoda]